MENLTKYLKEQKFEKQLEELKKKYKDKRVVIYGAGKLFKTIVETYNLSGLNIVGICDKKYLPEDENNKEYGYEIIPYNKLNHVEADCIIVTVKSCIPVCKNLKNTITGIKIIPLIKINFIQKILYALRNSYRNKFICLYTTNKFVLIKTNGRKVYNPRIKNLEVRFWGENNYIEIHEPFVIRDKAYISCVNNCKVVIKKNNYHKKSTILMGSNNELEIGQDTTIEETQFLQRNSYNNKLIIGYDCQLSYGIIIRTTDGHKIYDKYTKEVLNPPKDVLIGNHVWIGANTMVLKNAEIPSNCVIGACSLVNKKFKEENCIIAGTPAKVIKKDINWDRRAPAAN